MPEQDARDSDSALTQGNAPQTPRVSGEVGPLPPEEAGQPESSLRSAQPGAEPMAVSEPGDTLLSAGKPADRLELLLEDRLSDVDGRLQQLEARIAVLERRKPTAAEPQKPWLWIAFLIALVVVFQLLRLMR